jgi:L-iditol 2-dehydrogenase
MAEYVVVPAENVLPIAHTISFEQAATVEPATVALHAFRQAGFQAGKSVAVLGCGIIGLYAVQWARILGASSITAISRGQEGLDTAKVLGADEQHSTNDCSDEELLTRLDKHGYDYVMESSGSARTMQLSLKIVAKKGTVCMIGTPKKELAFPVSLWEQINRKECWVTGSWMSYSAPFPGEEWTTAISCMQDGRLKYLPAFIDGPHPMEKAWEAFERIHTGAAKGRSLLVNERFMR